MSLPGGPLIPAVIVGGVAYELAQNASAATPPGRTSYATDGPNGYSHDPALDNGGQAGFNYDGRSIDPDAGHKLDMLSSAMEQTYNNMSQTAKSAAAGQLNQSLGLNPPLKGDETWETVAKVAGSAGGAAACSLIPGVGVAVAPLCAMAGAYLGVKLEEWMSTALPDLKNWVSDNIVSNVGSAVSAVAGYVEDGVDEVVGWVKGLF